MGVDAQEFLLETRAMSALHIPVMLKEILQSFEPLLLPAQNPQIRYLDGTFGRGGHTRAVLESSPLVHAVALDRDLQAIDYGKQEFSTYVESGRLKLVHANYSDFESLNLGLFDLMLMDLGVSSPQLDQADRGFSFYHDGPLDMRMDATEPRKASDLIQELSEDELIELFKNYGEIQKPFRVVRAIVHDRKTKTFETTRDLAGLIERVEGWRKKGFHPATQYFQALRIEVNQELKHLEESLRPLVLGLKPKGRLAVLTFHSLEDRIVKNTFKSFEELGKPVNKKVIQPEWSEAQKNSRARSAKLRVFERASNAETH